LSLAQKPTPASDKSFTEIMRKTIFLILLTTVCALSLAAQLPKTGQGWIEFRSFHYEGSVPESALVRDSQRQYVNPILAGFYPDPSIVRMGGDYYLVNSSFSWYPGVPIFHSRDLVNWTQIGHVLDRPSQLPLKGAGVSRGIFAPTIRHHNGLFYMITTNVSEGGNFYVTARNPAGPWSDPVPLPEIDGIDPSFFFDDNGHAYVVHNGPPPENKALYSGHRAIWLFPFDEKAGKISGPGKIIVNGGTDISKQPVWIEGPHLLKHGEYYYLIAAEGGTEDRHSEVVFRSKAVTGPYEPYSGNPILTQRTLPDGRSDPVTSTGHADFVETQKGDWWAVFLGCQPYRDDFFNTGRQTFMLPVKWVDGWPIILNAGESVPLVVDKPALKTDAPPDIPTHGTFSWTDTFREERLPFVYNTLRTPREAWYRLDGKSGSLFIQPRADDLSSTGVPSLIAHRQQHANFSASVDLIFQADDLASDAGLVAFQNETHWYFLGVRLTRDAADKNPHRTLFLEKSNSERNSVASLPLASNLGKVTLKVNGRGAMYRFSFLTPGGKWQQIGEDQDGTILSTKTAGGFVGTYLGMFARSPK